MIRQVTFGFLISMMSSCCRPNARWLSLLDDFVTTNFGTRAPRARAPLEQNSGDATPSTRSHRRLSPPRNEILVTWYDVADNQQTIDINGVQSTVYQVWLSSHF